MLATSELTDIRDEEFCEMGAGENGAKITNSTLSASLITIPLVN